MVRDEPWGVAASVMPLLLVYQERIRKESLRAQECMSSPAETRFSGFVIVEIQVIRSPGKEKCVAAK
ncbi:hypothetical protein ACOCG7_00670 [Paraburkholderia sp. DD10]|uniref:hypothetical protein n=1 Tax=Paraburkholderia sp. DD10 TaxID=3409691 RepID=UPI003B9FDF09